MADERTMEWARKVSKALWNGEDPEAEVMLRAKCNWEKCSRTAVLKEWGDPRDWSSYTGNEDYRKVLTGLRPFYEKPSEAIAWMMGRHRGLGGCCPDQLIGAGNVAMVLAEIDRLASGAYV